MEVLGSIWSVVALDILGFSCLLGLAGSVFCGSGWDVLRVFTMVVKMIEVFWLREFLRRLNCCERKMTD